MDENRDLDRKTRNTSAPGPLTQEEKRAQAAEVAARAEVAFRTIIILLIAVAVGFVLELALAFQLGVWQMYAVTGITGAFDVALLINLWLMRRGHPDLGAGLTIGVLALLLPVVSLLITDMGLLVGLTVVLLSFTLAVQTLSQRYASRAIFAGIVSGIAALLLDLYGGESRLSMPLLQTALPAVDGLLILAYGVFIARQFRDYTLRNKLIIVFVSVTAVAVLGTSFITFRAVRSAFEAQIGENYTVGAESLGRFTVAFFEARVTEVMALTMLDSIKEALVARNQGYSGSPDAILAAIQALDAQWLVASDDDPLVRGVITPDPALNPTAHQLAHYLETFPDQSEIFVTDRYGATLGATGRLSDYYQADEGWWQAAWNDGQGAIYVSDPEYDESAGVTASLIAAPIFDDETGEIVGILRSTLVLDRLFAAIEATRYGETGHAVLLDGSAGVLYEPAVAGEESSAELPLDLRQRLINQGRYLVEADADDDRSLFARWPIAAMDVGYMLNMSEAERAVAEAVADLGWAIVVRQEAREAFAPVDQLARQAQLVGVVIIVLAGVAAWGMARLLTEPVLALTTAADALGAGDLDVTLPPARGDEIGRLTVSFGNMTGQLKRTLSRLQERNAHLQAAVQQYSDCMAEVGQGNLEARIVLEDAGEQDDPLVTLGHNLNLMTANLQRVIEQERSQREIIQAQRQAILELSTPVIPVMHRIIVLPLVGEIDSARAQDIMRALLAGIRAHRARVVILDITGVPVVDSGVATHLHKTIQAARLKGARTIITGVSDAVAEAVVDLGIDWSQVTTLSDLQSGLRAALAEMGLRIA